MTENLPQERPKDEGVERKPPKSPVPPTIGIKRTPTGLGLDDTKALVEGNSLALTPRFQKDREVDGAASEGGEGEAVGAEVPQRTPARDAMASLWFLLKAQPDFFLKNQIGTVHALRTYFGRSNSVADLTVFKPSDEFLQTVSSVAYAVRTLQESPTEYFVVALNAAIKLHIEEFKSRHIEICNWYRWSVGTDSTLEALTRWGRLVFEAIEEAKNILPEEREWWHGMGMGDLSPDLDIGDAASALIEELIKPRSARIIERIRNLIIGAQNSTPKDQRRFVSDINYLLNTYHLRIRLLSFDGEPRIKLQADSEKEKLYRLLLVPGRKNSDGDQQLFIAFAKSTGGGAGNFAKAKFDLVSVPPNYAGNRQVTPSPE